MISIPIFLPVFGAPRPKSVKGPPTYPTLFVVLVSYGVDLWGRCSTGHFGAPRTPRPKCNYHLCTPYSTGCGLLKGHTPEYITKTGKASMWIIIATVKNIAEHVF